MTRTQGSQTGSRSGGERHPGWHMLWSLYGRALAQRWQALFSHWPAPLRMSYTPLHSPQSYGKEARTTPDKCSRAESTGSSIQVDRRGEHPSQWGGHDLLPLAGNAAVTSLITGQTGLVRQASSAVHPAAGAAGTAYGPPHPKRSIFSVKLVVVTV